MSEALPFLSSKDKIVLGRTGPFFFFPSYRLSEQERSTHMYMLGITGQGKSKLCAAKRAKRVPPHDEDGACL